MYLLYGVQGGGPPRPPHTYYGEIKRASHLASQKGIIMVNLSFIWRDGTKISAKIRFHLGKEQTVVISFIAHYSFHC